MQNAGRITVSSPREVPGGYPSWILHVIPTRSGGNIRPQAEVLVKSLMPVLRSQRPTAVYEGYTVTPISGTRRTLVFAEFDRGGRIAPTAPFRKTLFRERLPTIVLDRWIPPWV